MFVKRSLPFILIMIIPLCIALTMAVAEDSKGASPKISVVQNGSVQGMWAETPLGVLAVVTKNARANSEDPTPYVCVYVKDADGKTISMPAPYAIHFDHGEVHLQVPIGKTVKIVPMRKIIDLLNADEAKKSIPLGSLPIIDK